MNVLSNLRPVFVARASAAAPPAAGPPGGGPPQPPQPASPVFLTPQSLASFPGAALAINILWNVVAVLSEDLARVTAVPLALAFIVGVIIYFVSVTAGMSTKDKILGAVVAVINSAWLGLNALGVNMVKPPG